MVSKTFSFILAGQESVMRGPLEGDINIAVNGPFWVEVANQEHPFTAMLISRSMFMMLVMLLLHYVSY